MKYILFYIFSFFEYSSLICLSLALFRFEIKYYMKEIITTSLLNAFLSLVLSILGLQGFALFIQIVAIIISFIIIFDEKFLKSIWMGITGYTLSIVIQIILISIVDYFNLFDVTNINPYAFSSHMVQVGIITVSYLVVFIIVKSNEGFGFSFHKKIFTSSKKIFLLISIIVILGLSMLFFMLFASKIFIYFILIAGVSFISIFALFYLSAQQDSKQFKREDYKQ